MFADFSTGEFFAVTKAQPTLAYLWLQFMNGKRLYNHISSFFHSNQSICAICAHSRCISFFSHFISFRRKVLLPWERPVCVRASFGNIFNYIFGMHCARPWIAPYFWLALCHVFELQLRCRERVINLRNADSLHQKHWHCEKKERAYPNNFQNVHKFNHRSKNARHSYTIYLTSTRR